MGISTRYGALEAGGTKMVCAIGTAVGAILDQCTIPTRRPEETIPEILAYFRAQKPAALGVASFGPLDLDRDSPTYGHIRSTPKPGWSGYDLIGVLEDALRIPIDFDTDVTGSLLGETVFGSSKGISDVVYLTIGTGIGGGILSYWQPVHGMQHPELGHIRIVPHPKDTYAGCCPFHRRCFEGMASGPAIEARWGASGALLADRPEVWELEAYYIGQALANIILTVSPKRIILGGGVMHQSQLFPLIREEVSRALAGYLDTPLLRDLDDYIVPASLGDDQGILGALCLAIDAWDSR